jgi:acetoin utilization deacetylase AcuC-like enzyme
MPAFLPIISADAYEVDLGGHVFITAKYRLVRDRLLAEGAISREELLSPEPATDAQVLRVHTPQYVEKIRAGTLSAAERMRLEVPFTDGLREAMWLCAGGTLLTARQALEHGVAVHLGGGFHHAFAGHGEGFCLINDVAIAVRALQDEGGVRRSVIVDLDVHQGNGTASIFAGDAEVFTFSMHQENNYPARKPASDLDIGLPDRTGDAAYLALLEENLPRILQTHRPQLAFYLAGADPWEGDQLGGLALTRAGLRQRDDTVLRLTGEAGVPVAIVLAGGYAHSPDDTVEIHCNTVRAARARVH